MVCKSCGKQNPDGHNSCSSCGAPLIAASSPGLTVPSHVTFHPAKKKLLNLPGVLGALAAAISVFLPFARLADPKTISMYGDGTNSYWIITLLAAAAGAVFACFGLKIGMLLSGIACIITGMLENSSLHDQTALLGEPYSRAFGFWLLIAGCALLLIGGITGFLKARKPAE